MALDRQPSGSSDSPGVTPLHLKIKANSSSVKTLLTKDVELAKTGRAGCQNSACKNNGVKIEKGELRMGTLVTIKEHSSWMWKHW